MATTTKKELTNQIAHRLSLKQMLVRDVVQTFLDECIRELRDGNRLEFRDFGVFETVSRAARKARNPKTGEVVQVPPKTVVDFKMGKQMKALVNAAQAEKQAGAAPSERPAPPPTPAAPAEPAAAPAATAPQAPPSNPPVPPFPPPDANT